MRTRLLFVGLALLTSTSSMAHSFPPETVATIQRAYGNSLPILGTPLIGQSATFERQEKQDYSMMVNGKLMKYGCLFKIKDTRTVISVDHLTQTYYYYATAEVVTASKGCEQGAPTPQPARVVSDSFELPSLTALLEMLPTASVASKTGVKSTYAPYVDDYSGFTISETSSIAFNATNFLCINPSRVSVAIGSVDDGNGGTMNLKFTNTETTKCAAKLVPIWAATGTFLSGLNLSNVSVCDATSEDPCAENQDESARVPQLPQED